MFEDGNIGFTPVIEISPELYFQTDENVNKFNTPFKIKDMTPFMNLGLRLKLGDMAYAFGNWGVISPGITNDYNKKFRWNAEKLKLTKHDELLDGGFLLGNDFMYGGIFRTSQEMGYGLTGNLMVADNFRYQDFLRGAIRTKWFDYTLNLTHFDSAAPSTGSGTDINLIAQKFNGMHQFQAVHRYEFKFFNKVRLMLMEGIMINSTSSFDIRFLSPFIYLHSLNNHSGNTSYAPGMAADEANNYTTAELSWTIIPHLQLNLQLLMDQIQLSSDKNDPNVLPQAYGALLSIESPWLHGKHYVNTWFEAVLIMPYTYLNNKKLSTGLYDTNLDMIVGYKNNHQDELSYAGYGYGPDSITLSIGSDFGIPEIYESRVSLTFQMHGKNGLGYTNIILPTGAEHFSDIMFDGLGIKNAYKNLLLECFANYIQLKYINIAGRITLNKSFWPYDDFNTAVSLSIQVHL